MLTWYFLLLIFPLVLHEPSVLLFKQRDLHWGPEQQKDQP